jgi:hypothetical protein
MTILDETVTRARRIADTVVDATIDSVKQSQDITARAFQTFAGAAASSLGANSPSDVAANVRSTVNAGYDLAKEVLDHQRQIAEKVIGALTHST